MPADHIRITRTRQGVTVTVDGTQIPPNWITRDDGVNLPIDPDEPPFLDLRLVAHRVDVVNGPEVNEEDL